MKLISLSNKETFLLELSREEVNRVAYFLVNKPQTKEEINEFTDIYETITYEMRYREAYDRYLAEQEG